MDANYHHTAFVSAVPVDAVIVGNQPTYAKKIRMVKHSGKPYLIVFVLIGCSSSCSAVDVKGLQEGSLIQYKNLHLYHVYISSLS